MKPQDIKITLIKIFHLKLRHGLVRERMSFLTVSGCKGIQVNNSDAVSIDK
jgi:hypothetical protein